MITINSRLKIVNPTPPMEAYTDYEFEVVEIGEHGCGFRIWDKDKLIGFGEMTHREVLTTCVMADPPKPECDGKTDPEEWTGSTNDWSELVSMCLANCGRKIVKQNQANPEGVLAVSSRYEGLSRADCADTAKRIRESAENNWRKKWITVNDATLQCEIDYRSDGKRVVDVRLHGSNKVHGRAKCAPDDVFSVEQGIKVAVCHLIERTMDRWNREIVSYRDLVRESGTSTNQTPMAKAAIASLLEFGEYAIADLMKRYSTLKDSMEAGKTK